MGWKGEPLGWHPIYLLVKAQKTNVPPRVYTGQVTRKADRFMGQNLNGFIFEDLVSGFSWQSPKVPWYEGLASGELGMQDHACNPTTGEAGEDGLP